MQHTKEEIINALQVIQDTCREMHGERPCEQCPLSDEDSKCILQNEPPEAWEIKTSPPVWKALE